MPAASTQPYPLPAEKPRVRSALAATGLASITVLLSVGASNAGRWSFSIYLLIPSLIALLVGASVVLLTARKRRNAEASTVAAVAAAFLVVGGGKLLEPLRGWGFVGLAGLVILIYFLAKRLFEAFDARWLPQWLLITLLVVNGLSLVRIAIGEFGADTRGEAVEVVTAGREGAYPDVVVLILDELASPLTAPLRASDTEKLYSLEAAGYQVHEAVLSPYTISSIAIPAILDGRYPLAEDDVFDRDAVLRLGAVSQGGSRLVESLKSVGYRYIHVESGLWMSSCGSQVDVCVEGQPLSEEMGVLLNQSAFRWWYHRRWGDAFIVSGLHSMTTTRRVVTEYADDDQPDLIIAHIMLPHFPYLLDDDCLRYPDGRHRYTDREAALAGYQRQAGCVVGWLTDTLTELDDVSPIPPAVVVVGDHGTNLAGQLERPVDAWSDEEAVERLASFAAFRFPDGCPTPDPGATPQITDGLIACFVNGGSPLERRHFLVSNAEFPADVSEFLPGRLDSALSVFEGAGS